MYYLFVTPICLHSLQHNIFSLSTKVSAIIIWSLVSHFIIFRLYLTFLEAALLILKHATVLRLSNTQKSALSQANLYYNKVKIDLTIQKHLLAYSSEDSVEQFVGFIMATEIGVFILLPVTIISHQAFSTISVFSQSQCIEKNISSNCFVSSSCAYILTSFLLLPYHPTYLSLYYSLLSLTAMPLHCSWRLHPCTTCLTHSQDTILTHS